MAASDEEPGAVPATLLEEVEDNDELEELEEEPEPIKKPAAASKSKAKVVKNSGKPGGDKVPTKKPAAKEAAPKVKAKAKAKNTNEGKPTQDSGEKGGKPKTGSLLDRASSWKRQMEDKEEAEGSEPEETCENGEGESQMVKRDFAKARKFKRMSDAQAIPDHIQEAMDKAKTRQDKSRIINELFEKDSKGALIMKAEKPFFNNVKTASHSKVGKDMTKAIPYDVFLMKTFRGDEAALTAAVEKGAVVTWLQDGLRFAGYRVTTAGVKKSVEDTHQVGSEAQDISQDTYKTLSKAFNSMAFVFGDTDTPGQTTSMSSNAASSEPAVLKELTEPMKALVQDAKSSMERLAASGMKMLQKCSSAADKQNFKVHVISMRAWISKDDHMLLWNEFEDGRLLTQPNFKAWMTEQAEAVVSLNEECEKFKAMLRSRKEL